MDNIYKRIKVGNNYIILDVSPGYCTEVIKIDKYFFKNEDLDKTITFSIWDDMQFQGWDSSDSCAETKIDFKINVEDKIYFALNRLLGTDDTLLIDDDETYKNWQNYLDISRKDSHILVSIHDNSKDRPIYDRFKVFIKNIAPDGRSKIEDFNVKYRLHKFFMEAKEILVNENHQYTFDEYFEILKSQKESFGKNPYMTKNQRKFKNPVESCLNCTTICNEENKSDENWCSNYESIKKLVRIK